MNDNVNPNDPTATEHARERAARSILPTLLSLLPLAVVTAACEWCARFIVALAKPDAASAMHEAADRELAPDVRAAVDVVCACVLGHTSIDALNDGPGDGEWEADYIAACLSAVQRAQERVTGLAHGERDCEGATTDVTALDVRERASTARRRSVALAIVATIPPEERAEVLAHVVAWESVLGGLARAAANTNNPAVMRACDAAAWETVQAFERATAPHSYAMNALSALWHNATPCYAMRALGAEDVRERRELAEECDAAAEDLAHVRALLSPVAA